MHRYLRAARPAALPLTLMPFSAGLILGARDGSWHMPEFLLCLAGILCLHASAFTFNEIYDYLQGADRSAMRQPDSWVTTPGTLLRGECTPGELRLFALACSGIAGISGILLSSMAHPVTGIVFMAGLFLAFFYTAPPLKLAYRGYGLGELSCLFGFGWIPAVAAYASLVKDMKSISGPVMISLPHGLLSAAILLEHDYFHWKADREAGKNTPVAVLGPRRAGWLLGSVLSVFYVSIVMLPATGLTSPWIMIMWITGIPVFFAWFRMMENPSMQHVKNTIIYTTHTLLLLTIALVFAVWFKM
ncbi:prenyltransferase [bacterium]|nr:prenyltransferase [bacterium]